ncbi:hypothetical protein JR316_0006761 [Psilocybe cubensis]|uniref:Uncharacterized protein n=1 Tax=Psilocybe cubensis TaxID=181762 RepID=A0ACB8GXA9_PSICU|nr:hypothetical protein JR316_0006761 [Psilocybe cubensis]KAH9480163.1 hypothetical protein JR316_0006761 [Psilocybe cubensis]
MTLRPNKRRRTGTDAHLKRSYYEEIDDLEDPDTVHSSEGVIRSIGGSRRATRIEHSPLREAGTSWLQWASWSPPDDEELDLNPDSNDFDNAIYSEVVTDNHANEQDKNLTSVQPPLEPGKPEKKQRSKVSKRPHVVWKETYRQSYLEEIIRWAGRGDFRHAKHCPDCVARSKDVPGRWTGSHFTEVSLRSLGLIVQLNHSAGYCESPVPCHRSMLVLHTNGIHSVNIQYCQCQRAIAPHLQLLRRRLYPATQLAVKTVATFELLQHLHKMALTTKASTYDFYRCLEKTTTNLGINVPNSRYRPLMRMVVQWRHLHMLKWAGRGHSISGVEGTAPGELAIRCPTCPHPGINLPEDWSSVPDAKKFLYAVFICMDANFRLKNQMVSNPSQDPGLGTGWAYMIEKEKYESYVKSKASEKDISTCVGFQALAKANTKFSKGLRYTGVGAAICGRSEMIFPTSVGNLQKGERYANMDYVFGMALKTLAICLVLASYNVCCQWFTKLLKRIKEDWPPEIKPPQNLRLTPAIPKLHERMHKEKNHHVYSLNLIPGVGHTDGECPERVWGPHNPLANATKTQGPGTRQDTLDDHFGFWNWQKYSSLSTTLLRRYRNAITERNIQTEGHRGLTRSLQKEHKEKVEQWEAMCEAWEADTFPKTVPNPYDMPDNTLSEAQVKKDLAEAEAAFLAEGGSFPHATTASMFISQGLDLEEAQRRIQKVAKGVSDLSTVRQAGSLTEQRNILSTRIRAWELLQPVYMPGILQYQADHPITTNTENPEDSILRLPSTIPEPHRSCISTHKLPLVEEKLWHSQLIDSLSTLRQILKFKSRMIHFKKKNIRGQRDGTRSTSVIDRVHERARFAAQKYRAARVAYMSLRGPGDWEETFQKLEDKDIRGYQDPERIRKKAGRRGTLDDEQVAEASLGQGEGVDNDEEDEEEEEEELTLLDDNRVRRDGSGETRRTLSWIWTVNLGGASEEEEDNVMRVEWAKSRARSQRASEEVMLLKEEMRRALAFFSWKADWWRSRQNGVAREGASKDLLEGISAYALSQAEIQELLGAHCEKLWRHALDPALDIAQTSEVQMEDDDGGDETEEELEASIIE